MINERFLTSTRQNNVQKKHKKKHITKSTNKAIVKHLRDETDSRFIDGKLLSES